MVYVPASTGYDHPVPEWIPRPTSAKGRLALAALDAFGRNGFDRVNVVELAKGAGVTTGALYHHFGNKLGLYEFVRDEAQRRVLDRMEGAAAARADGGPVEAGRAALLVAFDHCAAEGLTRILAEPEPSGRPDQIALFLSRLATAARAAPAAPGAPGTASSDVEPLTRMLAAAWRAALQAVADGIPVEPTRRALASLRIADPLAPAA